MPDATIKRLDDVETFDDGLVTPARAEFGVTSWGMLGSTAPSAVRPAR